MPAAPAARETPYSRFLAAVGLCPSCAVCHQPADPAYLLAVPFGRGRVCVACLSELDEALDATAGRCGRCRAVHGVLAAVLDSYHLGLPLPPLPPLTERHAAGCTRFGV